MRTVFPRLRASEIGSLSGNIKAAREKAVDTRCAGRAFSKVVLSIHMCVAAPGAYGTLTGAQPGSLASFSVTVPYFFATSRILAALPKSTNVRLSVR